MKSLRWKKKKLKLNEHLAGIIFPKVLTNLKKIISDPKEEHESLKDIEISLKTKDYNR